MEGLLARWALTTQEYDFTISYQKGTGNSHADAFSHKPTYNEEQCAATLCLQLPPNLQAEYPLNFMMYYNLGHLHKDESGTINHCDDTNKFGHSYF